MYYLFTVQNKNFQIQNTIQCNLMLRRAFSQNPSTQKQTFLILKMEFKCSKELDFWKSKRPYKQVFLLDKSWCWSHFSYWNSGLGLVQITANFLTNLESPGSLENLLFQGREGFVELPNFPFSEECVNGGGWYRWNSVWLCTQTDWWDAASNSVANLELDLSYVLRAPKVNMTLWK